MVRRGLAPSRADARVAIEAGRVLVRGFPAERPATRVSSSDAIVVQGAAPPFVSRGGLKLEGALIELGVSVEGQRWLDAGASTGGFTDCLLQHGAAEVVAADVGYGQLAWSLRQDERVHVLERCNLRFLTSADLPWRPEGVAADLSFISLTLVLPALASAARPDARFLCLVKPQFELDAASVGKGGVVRDPELWKRAVDRVVAAAGELRLVLRGASVARPAGPAGNREFFVYLARGGDAAGDVRRVVMEAAMEESS